MAKTKLSIVPKPKSIRFGCGEYKLPPAIEISISAGASGELRTAEKILGKYGTRITSVKKMDWDYSCLAAGNSQNIFPLREKKPAGKEGYVLSVTKQGVGIRANTDAGLFYALQTLAQILEDTRTLPAVRIADYPDLEMRGLHLDFKGGFSTRKHLREMVEKLAGCKINTLLVEYEDKIVYAKNKKFVSPYALSPSEVAEFLKHCRVHHIQVIPLLQSLGHVEYILRHPAYSHLREGENCSQFCPSNPASLKLFEECAAELAELHPEAEWFHIGGDETRALGTCPVCKRKADKSGKTALYVEYITKAIQIIRKLGKKPIIWDDMLTRSGHPELLDNLPEGTTLMYWQYAVTEKESSSIQLEAYLASRRWLTKGVDKRAWEKAPDLVHNILEKDFPDEIRRAYNIYEKYFITKKSPLFFDSLPYLKILRKKKIPVIGASACRTSLDQRFPDVDWRMRNIKFWADVAKTNGLPGVISTSWARAASLGAPGILPEDSWYLMVAAGEFYWNTDSDIRDFDARFNFRFLGIADTRATDLQYSMVECKNLRYHTMPYHIAEEFGTLLNQAKRNERYLEYVHYLMRVQCILRFLHLFWLDRYAGHFTHLGPAAGIPRSMKFRLSLYDARKEMKDKLHTISQLRREGVKLYGQTIFKNEARERVEVLLRPIEAFYECGLKEMERAVRLSGKNRK